jgi:hypothetical protein
LLESNYFLLAVTKIGRSFLLILLKQSLQLRLILLPLQLVLLSKGQGCLALMLPQPAEQFLTRLLGCWPAEAMMSLTAASVMGTTPFGMPSSKCCAVA